MNISTLVNKQRDFFMKGTTLDYSFRLDALYKLSAAISGMEIEILAALATDLNKSEIAGHTMKRRLGLYANCRLFCDSTALLCAFSCNTIIVPTCLFVQFMVI